VPGSNSLSAPTQNKFGSLVVGTKMPRGLTKKTFPRGENNHINQFDHTTECQIQIKHFLALASPPGLEKKRTN